MGNKSCSPKIKKLPAKKATRFGRGNVNGFTGSKIVMMRRAYPIKIPERITKKSMTKPPFVR